MWCQRVNSAALRRRGSCCLSASLRRHLLMAFPQSSSHLPYISSLFFESLFPLQRLSYIVSSPYISSVSLSCLLGCLYSHRISSFIFSRVSPCISFYRLLALIIIISHLLLIPCLALVSRLLLSDVHTAPSPSCRDLLLCRVCCSFIALHFALTHFSYYTSLPPNVVSMLYSEFLDSKILKEMSICLVLRITVYFFYNMTLI